MSLGIVLSLYSLFFAVCQIEDYQNKLKLSCRPLALTSNRAFLKNKKRVKGQSSLLISCMIFEGKYFSCYIPLPDQISWYIEIVCSPQTFTKYLRVALVLMCEIIHNGKSSISVFQDIFASIEDKNLEKRLDITL